MTASTRRFGVVMDPIESIKPQKDSTLAMLLEASRRGAEIHYLLQSDLKLVAGEALGRSRLLTVRDSEDDWFDIGEDRSPHRQAKGERRQPSCASPRKLKPRLV